MKLPSFIILFINLIILSGCSLGSITNEVKDLNHKKDSEYGIVEPLIVQNDLRNLMQKVKEETEYHVEFVSELEGIVITRKLEFDGKSINYYFNGVKELQCETIREEDRGNIRVFQLEGCNNTEGILDINFSE
jgi:DNA-dependent RNA polymerase auxiliary subunit epsilon